MWNEVRRLRNDIQILIERTATPLNIIANCIMKSLGSGIHIHKSSSVIPVISKSKTNSSKWYCSS